MIEINQNVLIPQQNISKLGDYKIGTLDWVKKSHDWDMTSKNQDGVAPTHQKLLAIILALSERRERNDT